MSKKAQKPRSKTPGKPKSKTPGKSSGSSPVTGWRKIQKPKMTVKSGEAARQAERERAYTTPTLLGVVVRLLPVWVLLIVVLILAPTLPFRAVGAVIGWLGDLIPERPAEAQPEPVFIVEGASVEVPVSSELPQPNWELKIAGVFTPEVQHWSGEIAVWSLTYRIKPNMIATVMQIESCGDPTAESEVGATGLFQVMGLHFEEGEDPYDPDTNAQRGLLVLGDLLASVNGDTGLAFAAYNGGPSVLLMTPAEWPSETQDYQYWASGIYEEAERGLEQSPTLQDWLNAGGSSLCEQAAAVLDLE